MESLHCARCLKCFIIGELDQIESNQEVINVNRADTTNLLVNYDNVLCKTCKTSLGVTYDNLIFSINVSKFIIMRTAPTQ